MGLNDELSHLLLTGYGTLVLTLVGWCVRTIRKSEIDFRAATNASIATHGERLSRLEGRMDES